MTDKSDNYSRSLTYFSNHWNHLDVYARMQLSPFLTDLTGKFSIGAELVKVKLRALPWFKKAPTTYSACNVSFGPGAVVITVIQRGYLNIHVQQKTSSLKDSV
ncbi:predicted protein [Histoplasma capsulatum H143]|uniref:Uncharacterized protein n=1 Tax=Ajellomyces capsulatus (strain H143) TaxID=544712 RepID=C6HLS2_AJECH|nr:predicted protein [Histoplasma capsulatum H143]